MSKAPARSLFTSFADGLRPLDDLTVSQWADRHRQLTSTESAERGQWRTSRVPYLRAVMDALGPHDPCERVVLMKGTQTGGTESAMNWIGFTVGHDPAPMLVMQPTESMAERFSKQRLAKLIESTPSVRERIKPAKGRDSGNTILLKEFPGGVLILAGANSATGFRSMPAKRVALDEVDAYPHDVDAEGDPVDLAVRRASNFPDRKVLLISTPTIAEQSRIEKAYNQGTREHYWVPCPHCDHYQVLQWKGIVWDEGKPETALYYCEACGIGIANHEKEHMLPRGEWRPTLGDDGEPVGDGRTRSFHLPSLYAPHGLGYSWPELARMWLESKDDPATLKVFINTILAETWKEDVGTKPDASPLFARREDYGRATGPDDLPLVPAEVAVLTAAVDVQHDRLELLVVGWGMGREAWHVHHRVLEIDPTSPQVWDELAECIEVAYPHETLGSMKIRAVCVDSSAYTQDVYKFVEGRKGKRPVTWAIKGQSDVERRLPIWPSASTRSKSRSKLKGAPLIRLGVDTAKETIYARLRLTRPADHQRGKPLPGYMHFSLACTEDYFAQLTAEVQRVRMSKGYKLRYWWKPDNQANEILDLWAYNLGALEGLTLSAGVRLDRLAAKLPPIPPEHSAGDTPTKAVAVKPAPAGRPAPRRPARTGTKPKRQVYDW